MITWQKALTIREAVQSFPFKGQIGEQPSFLYNKWKSQKPFDKNGFLEKRLIMDNLGLDTFQRILAEDYSVDNGLAAPDWVSNLYTAYHNVSAGQQVPIFHPEKAEVGFINLIVPLIKCELSKLKAELTGNYGSMTDPEALLGDLTLSLFDSLLRMINRTLVLELNLARLKGKLTGESHEQRFASFLRILADSKQALKIMEQYPVLCRQLVVFIQEWRRNITLILQRTSDDYNKFGILFEDTVTPGKLIGMAIGAGDLHNGGQSVVVLKFDSGHRVVYKPRSLSVDIHFQELLAWVNGSDVVSAKLPILRLINRDTYGWVEFVSQRSCQRPDDLNDYYRRIGNYLAILYSLNAHDFHYENIIADGANPYLIDLESFFRPVFPHKDSESFLHTVLQSGLLPTESSIAGNQGSNLSGLSNAAGQVSPRQHDGLVGIGRDDARMRKEVANLEGGKNLPSYNNHLADCAAYKADILMGFREVYHLFIAKRTEFSNQLHRFKEDEIRVLFRHTYVYGHILEESYHPDFMRDARHRDLHFDRLWLSVPDFDYLTHILPFEKEALERSDIPFFSAQVDSVDIRCNNQDMISGFFSKSGWQAVVEKIELLSLEDMNWQCWLIEKSLQKADGEIERSYQLEKPVGSGKSELFLQQAEKVAAHLMGQAYNREKIDWLSTQAGAKGNFFFTGMGIDLYSGLAGTALFYGHLAAITGKEMYVEFADKMISTITNIISQPNFRLGNVGGYLGWGGIIYTLSELSVLQIGTEVNEPLERALSAVDSLINDDLEVDVLGGAAGCILALSTLDRKYPALHVKPLIKRLADLLMKKAVAYPTGCGWMTNSKQALTGFSHGASGIALALFKAHEIIGKADYRRIALLALDYERGQFLETENNWKDLRDDLGHQAHGHSCAVAWCNGAPGIGLSRLAMLRHNDSSRVRQEIDLSLKTTLHVGFGMNHSLCHGDLGNLDLLLKAVELMPDSELVVKKKLLSTAILDSMEKYGWVSGISRGVETPGLMLGLAGIGYQMLRLYAPEKVPSALLLETSDYYF